MDSEFPKKEDLGLEDGFYKIPIKLWHSIEEKESMGNKALNQTAEIEVKNKEGYLYIGSGKMEYMKLIASLVNLYVQKEDGIFYPADRGSFTMEIPDEEEKRPSVFKTSLLNKNEMTYVYVDPKVEPMGDAPIKARLKLDFSKLEKINYEDAKLIKEFEEGPKKKEFNPKEKAVLQNKGIWVYADPDTFDKEYTFYGNKLSGKAAEEVSSKFTPLDQVAVYNIEFLGPVDKVLDKEDVQGKREKIKPKKDFEIKLPLFKFSKDDNLRVYDFTEGKKEVNFEIDGEHVKFRGKNPGNYALVKVAENKTKVTNSIDNKTQGPKIKTTNSQKISRAKAFMNSVKAPKSQKIKTSTSSRNLQSSKSVKAISKKTPSLEEIKASVKAQGENASSNLGIKASEKTEKANTEDKETLKGDTRESKAIIFFAIVIILAINITSIIFIKKCLNLILNLKDEERLLKELRRKEWKEKF